jgi:hypothetical protein
LVINTHYKFIFVHIPKAAGTSVMESLSSLKGNNTSWLARTKHETLADFERAFETRRSPVDRSHGIDPRGYFGFGFVRNPWDRMASLYRYMLETRPVREIDTVTSFKDFLAKAQQDADWIKRLHSMRPQVDYFTTSENRLKIDFLGHYEYLQEDVRAVEARIGCSIAMRHLNRSSNAGRDYREDYDAEMVEIVAQKFAEDVRQFGYQFDQRFPARRCSGSLDRGR